MADPDDQLSYRAELLRRAPWWLRGWLGGRLLYAIGVQLDVLADMALAAVTLRWPQAGNPEALAAIGSDRKIPRGRAEASATYIVRLRRWLDDHRTRGGPYAMLAQLHAFWAVAPFVIVLAYALGTRYTMPTDGSVTMARGPGGGPWPRWWLWYNWPTVVHSDGIWSDPGAWSDGGVWDSDLSADDVADIRLVPTAWNAAHCTGQVVLISPGAELWDYPDGLWNEGGVWGGDGNVAIVNIQ
jgi:hypothetical protein